MRFHAGGNAVNQTPDCLAAVLCWEELEPFGLFLSEKPVPGDLEVVGLLSGLEPRWDCMPPDLLDGPLPLLIFIGLILYFAQKKARVALTGL